MPGYALEVGHVVGGKAEYNAQYYKDHHEGEKARSRIYYWAHRDGILPKQRQRVRDIYRRQREMVLTTIAAQYGDTVPRCRIDLTPNSAVSDLPCRGRLEIDHINGGGRREAKEIGHLTHEIAMGRREISDLRILCRLHQLWNDPYITAEV